MTTSPQIHTVVSMPFQENSYVVWRPDRPDALVIDPGLEPHLILDFLSEQGLTVAALLNTHGHLDHIAGNEALKRAFPRAPLLIGAGDANMLTDPEANLSAFLGEPVVSPPADRLVREGDVIESAGVELEVRDLPGHSPGHVVFVYRGAPCLVFGGDTLMRGSVGRTDFPGGDAAVLFEGIWTKLFTLPPETVVYPGHGPVTTVAHEKRTNPFVGEQVR
ncbi:MAG: MBL fold metallo-hydrolase [Gemmataceae bacterium]|nr:MBL fold metallo-hydrolase [Gemmataceae bacterium]